MLCTTRNAAIDIYYKKKDDKKKDNILKKGGKCDIIWLSFMEEFEIVEERRIGV